MTQEESDAFEPFRPPGRRPADAGPGPGGPPSGPRADAEPGVAPGPRVSAAQRPAYLAAGSLLLVPAGALIAWVVRGFRDTGVTVPEFALALVTDAWGAQVHQALLTEFEWALTAALLAVAAGLFAGRRLARGGGLLLSALLLAVALRQAVGAFDEEYRRIFTAPDHGGWLAATYVAAGLAGLATLLLLLAAGRGADGAAKRGFDPYGPRRTDPRQVRAGALALAGGALTAGWLADRWSRLDGSAADVWAGYLRVVLNPAAEADGVWRPDLAFHETAVVVALLVAGVLLITDRPAARGVAVTALGVFGYLQLRRATGLDYASLDVYFQQTRGLLWLLSALGGVLLAAAGLLLLVLPRRRAATERWDGLPSWYPGDDFAAPGGRGRARGTAPGPAGAGGPAGPGAGGGSAASGRSGDDGGSGPGR